MKLRANASRRKAMSYARMSEKEKILADEVFELLAQAEAIDQSEDVRFGKDSRGDELPQELRRRESRLAKIREAKQALEDEAGSAPSRRPERGPPRGVRARTLPRSGSPTRSRRRCRNRRRSATSPTRSRGS